MAASGSPQSSTNRARPNTLARPPEREEPGPGQAEHSAIPTLPSSDPLPLLAPLAVIAVWTALVFTPALRGWTSGIAQAIAWSDAAANLLSQLLAVFGVLVVGRLLATTLWVSAGATLVKMLLFPAGLAVLLIVTIASTSQLSPLLSLGAATASALAAVLVAPVFVSVPHFRASSLVLTIVGFAALLQALARRLALQASMEALSELFATARALATAASLAMLVASIIAFSWLYRARERGFMLRALLLVGTITALALGAQMGLGTRANSWAVLLARCFLALGRHPAPLLTPTLYFFVLVLPLVVATLGLFAPRPRGLKAIIVLALLAGTHTDLAPMALVLVGAAAGTVLHATGAPLGPRTPAPSDPPSKT